MNAQLKIIKQELRAQEAAEAARRDAEVEVIENRKIARKALEKRRFDRAQEQVRLLLVNLLFLKSQFSHMIST